MISVARLIARRTLLSVGQVAGAVVAGPGSFSYAHNRRIPAPVVRAQTAHTVIRMIRTLLGLMFVSRIANLRIEIGRTKGARNSCDRTIPYRRATVCGAGRVSAQQIVRRADQQGFVYKDFGHNLVKGLALEFQSTNLTSQFASSCVMSGRQLSRCSAGRRVLHRMSPRWQPRFRMPASNKRDARLLSPRTLAIPRNVGY